MTCMPSLRLALSGAFVEPIGRLGGQLSFIEPVSTSPRRLRTRPALLQTRLLNKRDQSGPVKRIVQEGEKVI